VDVDHGQLVYPSPERLPGRHGPARVLAREKKVEHHPGRGIRVVPIFPELRPHLELAYRERPAGAVYVVPQARDGANLRTQAVRIIAAAGVTRWKKLFTNLRVSRLNELVRDRRFASHVVDAWVGNSEKVRRDHYLLVTDADYQAAVSGAGEIPAQIPAHSPLISSHQEPSTLHDSREKRLYSHGDVENPQDAENQYPRQGSNL
jgi:hypothetical protein